MSRICIGVPCYQNVASETLEDYMRFAFYCGRRMAEHEFLIAIKPKSEQFRARNLIVEAALETGCDYLLFLDDDHVLDWEETRTPSGRYGMLQTLIAHMEADPKRAIVGTLYFHRGGDCRPVLMKEGTDGGTYWMREDEIVNGMQEVAVAGGGCMLIRMELFTKIKSPWFEPEHRLGTDLQLCKKAKEAGYSVWADTSIKIGHVLSKREVVTPNNRHRISMENASTIVRQGGGMESGWVLNSALQLYRMDAEEYLGMSIAEMEKLAERYNAEDFQRYRDDLAGYYATRGKEQLARQVCFHHTPRMVQQMEMFLGMVDQNANGYAADFGCGSSPIGMELALRGHRLDFIDVDGAGAYEFTKWRAKRRGIEDRCGWTWAGPYDYILAFDAIEHIRDWRSIVDEIASRLKEGGAFLTNYFLNTDFSNPEHVSMDHKAVQKYLVSKGIYPLNQILWAKSNLGVMDAKGENGNGLGQQHEPSHTDRRSLRGATEPDVQPGALLQGADA